MKSIKETMYGSGDYLDKHPDWHASDSPFKAKNIAKIIERNSLLPKTISEVGCGAGEILVNLHNHLPKDTIFSGYEISPQAYNICKSKERERLNFYCSDFFEGGKDNPDLILAIDVFEHIENYMGFLKKLSSRGTNFIFHIPLDMNVLSVIRDHPILNSRESSGHLHYFTKNTALMTLKDCGYRIVDFFYTAGGIELVSSGTLKQRLFKVPRSVFFRINEDLAARFLGGFSLMVLAE